MSVYFALMTSQTRPLAAHALATLCALVVVVLRFRWGLLDTTTGWSVMAAITLVLSLLGELAVRRIRTAQQRTVARYLLVAAVASVLLLFRHYSGWRGLTPLLLTLLAAVTAVRGLALGLAPFLSGSLTSLGIPARALLALGMVGGFAAVSFVVWRVWQDGGPIVTVGIIAAAVTASAEAVVRLRVISPELRPKLLLLFGTLLLLFVGLEVGLRFGTTRYMTWQEKNGLAYQSAYEPGHSGWLWVQRANTRRIEEKPEFTHEREINELGLIGEFVLEKEPGEYRILALGDSFTEGVGASVDETWLAVLERELAPQVPDWRLATLNAGVSGSDLFYEYMLLKERLLPYQPDLVVVALNSSDIADVIVRGGVERFQSDGSVAYRNGPTWEPLYMVSYLARVVVHDVLRYNWQLMSNAQLELEERLAAEHLDVAARLLRDLCQAQGIPLIIAVHPQPHEITADTWGPLTDLVRGLERTPGLHAIDLLERYRRDDLIDPRTVFEWFWPIDGHHNARGYEVMGKAIADEIVALSLLPGRAPTR